MSWNAWCWTALVLAAIPFVLGLMNVFFYRAPRKVAEAAVEARKTDEEQSDDKSE